MTVAALTSPEYWSSARAKLNTVIAQHNRIVTPEAFGAVGDGVTDDTAALQAAINDGGEVHLADVDYLITSITVPADRRIVGGAKSRLVRANTAGTAVAVVGPRVWLEHFDIINLKATASDYSVTNIGLLVQNPSGEIFDIIVQRVNIEKFKTAIKAEEFYRFGVDDCTLKHYFTGISLNKDTFGSVQSYTFTSRRNFLRGNINEYTAPVGSRGIEAFGLTDMAMHDTMNEFIETVGWFKDVDGILLSACYSEAWTSKLYHFEGGNHSVVVAQRAMNTLGAPYFMWVGYSRVHVVGDNYGLHGSATVVFKTTLAYVTMIGFDDVAKAISFDTGCNNEYVLMGDGVFSVSKGAITLDGAVTLSSQTTSTTSPSAGGAGALPATPAGYMTVAINGSSRKIPYY